MVKLQTIDFILECIWKKTKHLPIECLQGTIIINSVLSEIKPGLLFATTNMVPYIFSHQVLLLSFPLLLPSISCMLQFQAPTTQHGWYNVRSKNLQSLSFFGNDRTKATFHPFPACEDLSFGLLLSKSPSHDLYGLFSSLDVKQKSMPFERTGQF